MSARIPLSRGKAFAVVDEADYSALSRYNWRIAPTVGGRSGYAIRTAFVSGRPVTVYMHREIIGAAKGVSVDHANGDTLDNRRANLRLCDQTQNNANGRMARRRSSQFRGVHHLASGKWSARLMVRKKNVFLGNHDSEESAAIAYDQAAVEHFGQFATLNFPERA
jgi:hypothetical protein